MERNEDSDWVLVRELIARLKTTLTDIPREIDDEEIESEDNACQERPQP